MMLKTDNDFYSLLSAAMEYDSSFGDEELLNFHLEEGRIFYNRRNNNNNNNNNNKGGVNNSNHEKGKDDFEKAILILDEYASSSSFLSLLGTLSLFPWRLEQRKKGRPTRAITPSILSGLCSLARTNSSKNSSNSTEDDNVRPQQQQQYSSSSPSKITVSSSDLVLFCQGLQGQALRQLRRRRRQRRFLLPAILSLAIVIGLIRFSTVLANIDEGMQKFRYHRTGGVCGSITPMVVQHACHFMDATVFNIFYDEGFGSGAISSEGGSCQLLQQHQPHSLRVCNPGKYAMHLRLRNETISWDEVANDRPAVSGHRWMGPAINSNALTQEETVVNRLVRQAIERFSESFIINQPLHVLDIGSGLGASLYSLLPLLQNDLQIRRPSRRHAKKVMLDYTGFALSTAEVVNAQALAEQNLGDLVQDNVVNASFRLGNFVRDTLPEEVKSGTYNIVIAVESLSYPDKGHLQNMLRGIYNSLQKGGLLIIVDDVVLPKDPNDPDLQGKQRSDIRMQLFRAAFMRPSLIRHADWMMLFKEAGFTLIEARDLSLEYGLVPDEEDENLPYSSSNIIIRSGFGLWRYIRECYERVMMWILMSLTTVESEHETGFHIRMQSWLRLLLLQRGTFALQRGYALRKEAFRTAELGYNMYIVKR